MDLSDTPADAALRRRVRAWLRRNLPAAARDGRYEAGYVARHWPRAHGGRDDDAMAQTVVDEELVRARAPGLVGLLGIQKNIIAERGLGMPRA